MRRALLLVPLLAGCHDWQEGYDRCVSEGRCGTGGGAGGVSAGGGSGTGGGAATGGGATGGGSTGGSSGGGAGGSGGSGGAGGTGGGAMMPAVNLSWGTAEHDAGTLEPTQSASASLRLRNIGDLRSSVPTFELVDDAGVFDFTDMCGIELASQGFCSGTLTFRPVVPGTFRASLVARETASGSTATLPVIGVGRWADVAVRVLRSGTGMGSITFVNPPMNPCTNDAGCTYLVPRFSTVQLTAVPDESEVAGWSGACTSTTPNCTFTVSADAGATATVQLNLWSQVTVGISPAGIPGARVLSLDGGLDCPGDCSQRFPPGSTVILQATSTRSGTRPVRLSSQPSTLCAGSDAGACGFVMPMANVFVDAGFIGTNYIFPTSVLLPMDLTRAQYDTTCANLAADAGLFGGSWAAVLGNSGNSVPGVFSGRQGFIRPDGKPVVNTIDPLVAHVFYPPRVDERGRDLWTADAGAPLVVTGAGITGCFSWDMSGTSGAPAAGSASAGRGGWYQGAGSVLCSGGVGRIYCAQYLWNNPVSVPTPPRNSRFAFVTRVGVVGNYDADMLCQGDALYAGYDAGTYVALRATTSASALSRVRLDAGVWVRPDGVPLVESVADLAAGKLAAPNNMTVDNVEAGYLEYAWTGGMTIAQPAPDAMSNCNNWTSGSTAYSGSPVETTSGWFSAAVQNCGAGLRFYCLQQ